MELNEKSLNLEPIFFSSKVYDWQLSKSQHYKVKPKVEIVFNSS